MVGWFIKRFGLLMLVVTVSGCVHAVSEAVRQQADLNVSFEQLVVDPQAYLDHVVIAGGTILEAQNIDQTTVLEVLQRPLDGYEQPLQVDRSAGRFMARCDMYLDPAIYTQGRDVTVAGRVLGSQTGKVGESTYMYPLLSCLEIRLWPQTAYAPETYDSYPAWYWGFWFWRPSYFWHPYYPFYHRYHHRHH